ncbi:hypothetical protein SLEP1_g54629 [Rubroshorea leprosula]|uniref:AAA+ ATPase domain-containing protein n=1 Tax=Rubroshorea leprosula TaxID=152421 RepID=A0AAV5MFY9_9ROSI|nr:hypothetical protein SLEP1_g54629 [Rubroshorea leprosula]
MAEACICAVCQNAAGNVVGKLFCKILSPISNPITLVRNCNNNINNLTQRADELKLKKVTADDYVDLVHRRGQEIVQELEDWLTSAYNLTKDADRLAADSEGNAKKKCFFGLCLNPISRYQLSKNAKENSEAIVHLLGKPCVPNLPNSYIHSRKDVLERIMQALQSQSSSIIGVHGMPGMGKTMLAKEVKRKAEQDNLFDAVVMVLVSRNADLKKIQGQIARGLGLDRLPNGITTQDVAERIKERLKKMKKFLIILDDIWRPGIDLEELGIPLRNEPKKIEGSSSREEYAERKILLTSRDANVLSDLMGSQQNFPLHQLKYEEAWELLKRIVGDRAERDDIHSAAIEIVRKCGGLPLAITTMAKALRNREPYEWMDAVRILKRPSSENFDGIAANVYSAIELSYSHLESEKLKKTFLLCCLIGHGYSIQYLLMVGVGLGLFANTIEQARNEVLTLIRKLRASSLLIDNSDSNYFDMHDLIHDVAVSIASRDRHGLLLTGDHEPKEWSDRKEMKGFKWIRLQNANINGLPDEFEGRQLTFFSLENNEASLKIPEEFFEGMEELKVLDLAEMHFTSLPSSICLLKVLHTLCFYGCSLGDISIIGKLKNLEILIISCSDIEELPREIGELTQLKLLDLSCCSELKIIPQHVLARMSRLEELYLGKGFDGWGVEENENQRNASLAELKHLKKLTNLEVCIPDIQMIPKDFFFENLKRFEIFIGPKWEDQDSSFGSSRILKLHLNASISFNYSVKMLLKMTEELHLRELAGVQNVVDELNAEGFPDLKYLYIQNAPEVQHIIKLAKGVPFNAFPSLEELFLQNLINLEKIFQGRFRETAFNNLKTITIECCDEVKNLFSSSIARQLRHLQEISVTDCSNMEEIELQLSWINVEIIWHTSMTSSYIKKLTKLIIKHCDNLEYLFTSSMARDVVMLEHLEIEGCRKMGKVIFTENEAENGSLIFHQLRILEIKSLPKLERFCHGNYIEFPCLSKLLIESCPVLKKFISSSSSLDTCPPLFDMKVIFPKLEQLMIKYMRNLDKIWDNQPDASSFCQLNYLSVNSCNKLLNIFPFSMLERLQRLDKLEIRNCNSLEEILSEGLDAGQSQTQKFTPPTLMESVVKFVFPKLTQLDLYFLPKLKALCHQMHTIEWPSLKKLTVYGCEQVQIFASELSSFPRTNGDDQLEVSLFWTSKATFPSLEEMRLDWNGNMKEIWHGQHIPGDYFLKLKVLELSNLPRQLVVQPFLFQAPNLEKLVVSGASFHDIFKCQGLGGVEKPALAFTQLSGSGLSELHELTCLRKEESNLESVFSNLNILEVLRCSKLKNLVPSFVSFKNLTTLEVTACHELIYLIDYSTAKSMVQLTRMSISECDMLKEIMACVDDEVKDGIVFSQLKYLQLCVLPRLASFCSGSCNFEFLSLEEVIVSCPHMQIFSRGECSSPKKLQKVKLTKDGDEEFWEGNLNSTIQKMFIEKVGYCGLENLKFSEFPELIEIWNKKPQEILPFKSLGSLEVCNCNSFRYLLTTSMALGLTQLWRLKVANCAAMEQVIIGEGAEDLLPELFTIILESCPNLKCFYEGSSRLEFPRLYKITVINCPALAAFASSFSSDQKKEITTNDTESEESPVIPTQPFFSDKVAFPDLKQLTITHLKNLEIIWHNKVHADSFCKLESLTVENCDKLLAVFPSTEAAFPNLEGLTITHLKSLEMIWHSKVHADSFCKLESLTIENCDKLLTIFPSTEVAFPNLERLTINYLKNLEVIWHSKVHADFFCKLESLTVVNCDKLLTVFPSTEAAFPNLERLTISHLKNLEMIWHSKVHVDSFCKLESLKVVNCDKLLTVFPFTEVICSSFHFRFGFNFGD